MEIKPVKDIHKPKYPQKLEIDAREIKASVPKRWASNPAAKVALGTLAVVSLAGCAPEMPVGIPAPTMIITEQTVSPEASYYQTAGVPMAPTVNVAPLFTHGEGRGAFGGDMASMPAFLSEDEALAVINEAAKEYGLKFSSEYGAEFYNVLQPVTDLNSNAGGEETTPAETFITLKADFSDSDHGIAIEFISKNDVITWSRGPSMSTVEVYDTKDAAEQLSESMENASANGLYTAAVLYDPCDSSGSEAEARALSKEDIKAQAKDFFEWLKGQGVI